MGRVNYGQYMFDRKVKEPFFFPTRTWKTCLYDFLVAGDTIINYCLNQKKAKFLPYVISDALVIFLGTNMKLLVVCLLYGIAERFLPVESKSLVVVISFFFR